MAKEEIEVASFRRSIGNHFSLYKLYATEKSPEVQRLKLFERAPNYRDFSSCRNDDQRVITNRKRYYKWK